MIRRALGILAVVTVLMTPVVSASAATPGETKPTAWTPYRSQPFQLAAGTRCSFGLNGDILRDREEIRTLSTYPGGSPELQQIRGPLIVRYTNTSSGESVRRNLTGRATVRYGTDGSFTITLASGHFAAGLAATDPGGPGFFVLSGHGHSLAVAADGSRVLSLGTGRVENICDTLG